jgi:hypothetical protein
MIVPEDKALLAIQLLLEGTSGQYPRFPSKRSSTTLMETASVGSDSQRNCLARTPRFVPLASEQTYASQTYTKDKSFRMR